MPYNLPPVATGVYDDNPNEFFYSNKIFRAGSSSLRTSSLGEAKDRSMVENIWGLLVNSSRMQFLDEYMGDMNIPLMITMGEMSMPETNEEVADAIGVSKSEALKFISRWSYDNGITDQLYNESKANEDGYTTKDDPAICPNCNSDSFGYIMNGQRYEFEDVQSNGKVRCDTCGSEFTPRELVTIADGYYTEAKASEYTLEDLERVGNEWDNSSVAERKEIIIDTHNGYTEGHDDNIVKNWNELSNHTRTIITQGKSNESKASEDYGLFGDMYEEEDQAVMADGLADLQSMDNVYCKICGQDESDHRSEHPSSWGDMSHAGNPDMADQSNFGQITDHDFVLDENRLFESKASEKGEWDWLDKGADSKSVDYDKVKYEDDGVSDISVPNAEPKGADANEFLDNINFGLESIDYVYPTKANETKDKSYITESEAFEEEYEEFEDSDDEIIEETITQRKLTGYSDNSIARELHINYGVSHEEALEKVYSIEVSTNDKVAQTFFGKMYKECTESEKDELRMYSGSD
jgi:DNA-directed RNA polymerase subunit M/transcription elongation factor TFIIS